MSKFIWTDRAKQQLRQIDREQALDILHALTDYATSGIGQVKKLKGSGDLRLRVGDYRVRFEVPKETRIAFCASAIGKKHTGVVGVQVTVLVRGGRRRRDRGPLQ